MRNGGRTEARLRLLPLHMRAQLPDLGLQRRDLLSERALAVGDRVWLFLEPRHYLGRPALNDAIAPREKPPTRPKPPRPMARSTQSPPGKARQSGRYRRPVAPRTRSSPALRL